MGMIDERERHDLHTWAVETMGENRADIFMRSLPPRGWDELVTKDDLQAAKRELRADIHRESNKLLIALVASMLAATLGQEMIVRWFPPPPPQLILQPANR